MPGLAPQTFIWMLLGTALATALLCWLLLWLSSSARGRRLRRWFDRSWQPVFMQPYQPAPGKPQPPRP